MIGVFPRESAIAPVVGLVASFVFNFLCTDFKPFLDLDDSVLSIVLGYSISLFFVSPLKRAL